MVMGWSDQDWTAEMRRGVLEFCTLGLIARGGASYGYEIVRALADRAPLAAAEGTVYPLLRRLRNGGWLEARWQESGYGPPRQYYRLTAGGRRRLAAMRRDWRALVEAVDDYALEELASHA